MCGIAGYFETEVLNGDDLRKMTDAIAHRGPDGSGHQIWERTGLGHRRLAILDLSENAAQPMRYGDSNLWITYNGEVYNYLEIRSELESHGYRFRSNSDTEVVLAAFDKWDTAAFHKFNGMWALAIYDASKRRLILSCDRFGVKPLYYGRTSDGGLVFASELKAFLSVSKQLGLRWDLTGLRTAILTPLKLEGSGHTPFKGIFTLGGGEYLEAFSNRLTTSTWWRTSEFLRSDISEKFEEQVEEFKSILVDATKLRLRSDVPIATSLSGGLDSSTIVGILGSIGGLKKQAAFVHSFKNTPHDETEFAEKVLSYSDVIANWVSAEEGRLSDEMERIIYQSESIYPGSSDSAWRIYRSQRKAGYCVTIDGHGADEYLGGYTNYLPLTTSVWRIRQYKELAGSFFEWKQVAANAAKSALGNYRSRLTTLARLLYDPTLSVLSPSFLFGGTYESKVLAFPTKHFENSRLNIALYRDFHRDVLPRILKNFDIVSMANGVEVRMPFMDYRLVTFAFSLPSSSKINNGTTKFILRESAKGLIPEDVRTRKTKIGFNSPLSTWMAGPLKEWVRNSLRSPSPLDHYISAEKLQKMYERKILGATPNWAIASKFWLLLTARHWTRQVEKRSEVRW